MAQLKQFLALALVIYSVIFIRMRKLNQFLPKEIDREQFPVLFTFKLNIDFFFNLTDSLIIEILTASTLYAWPWFGWTNSLKYSI